MSTSLIEIARSIFTEICNNAENYEMAYEIYDSAYRETLHNVTTKEEREITHKLFNKIYGDLCVYYHNWTHGIMDDTFRL